MKQRLRGITLLGAALTALSGITVMMSGCGGSQSTAQSTAEGSYAGVWNSFGAPLSESGILSFTIDSHGRMTGSFTAGNGLTSFVDGIAQNSGNFVAQVSRHADTAGTAINYSVTGRFAPQQVDQTAIASESTTINTEIGATRQTAATPTPTPSASPSASASASADTYKAGLSGDFRETINGVEYAGEFQAVGGNTTTGG